MVDVMLHELVSALFPLILLSFLFRMSHLIALKCFTGYAVGRSILVQVALDLKCPYYIYSTIENIFIW